LNTFWWIEIPCNGNTIAWAATLLKPFNIKNKKYHKDKKVKNYKSKKKKIVSEKSYCLNTNEILPCELLMKFITIWDRV
jgi:hypothetical protein